MRLAAVILQIHPAGNPHGRLLLLDEPMSGLDVAQQAALDTLLSSLSRKGIGVVMSSHDLNHTLRHAPPGVAVGARKDDCQRHARCGIDARQILPARTICLSAGWI